MECLTVSESVDALSSTTRSTAPAILASLLDRLDADGRYALLKLARGGMRVGVSARHAKQAFAQAFAVPNTGLEDVRHALMPTHSPMFARGRVQTGSAACVDRGVTSVRFHLV